MNRRSRWPIVIVLLVALAATGVTRQFAASRRGSSRGGIGTDTASRGAGFSRMNSYAIALLLGGLRGPLVMILWTNSESQKAERNLEGVDTQIEWIRLLQPEFDTVHIFQMWNKAYNISVQKASLSNKYLTILDAVKYGRDVDHERADNINILYAIGSIFGDKLGDATEKVYYARRVRDESLPHKSRQKLATNDPGYRPLELDPVLDEKGFVLPEFLKSSGLNLVDPANGDVYDGSDLQYLKEFQPYPYGVSPHGFAYNYRKRAQLLMRLAKQQHAQLSELVIDTKPAGDLKRWAETEWERGRRAEIAAVGKPVPVEVTDLELASADLAPNAKIDETRQAVLDQVIYNYDLTARLAEAADREYADHLKRDKTNFENYESHRMELLAMRPLMLGDRDYLTAVNRAAKLSPEERATLLLAAKEQYRRAVVRYGLMVLRYYVDDHTAAQSFPAGVNRQNLLTTFAAKPDALAPEQVLPILDKSFRLMQAANVPPNEDAVAYLNNLQHANTRLGHLP